MRTPSVTVEGPSLVTMTARLRATPPELLEPTVDTLALVADTLERVDPRDLTSVLADALTATPPPLPAPSRAGRAAVAVGCWLVSEPEFIAALPSSRRDGALAVLDALNRFGEAVPVPDWLGADPDRQEEAARVTLRAVGLRPRGESHVTAEDRWTSISTRSRAAMLAQAARDQLRAEEVAAALAKKKAAEAAAQYDHV